MTNRKKQLAVAGGSFIAGIAVGIVSSGFFKQFCKESFNAEIAAVIREVKNQQKEFLTQVNGRLSDFRNRVKKELHEPIPDLYKATEGLSLDVQDIEEIEY